MKTHITYSHNGLLSVGHDPREAENVIYIFADRFLPPFRFVSSLFVSFRLFSSLFVARFHPHDRSDRSDPTRSHNAHTTLTQRSHNAHTTLTQSSRPNRRTQPSVDASRLVNHVITTRTRISTPQPFQPLQRQPSARAYPHLRRSRRRTAGRTTWLPPWNQYNPASCSFRPGRSSRPGSSGPA